MHKAPKDATPAVHSRAAWKQPQANAPDPLKDLTRLLVLPNVTAAWQVPSESRARDNAGKNPSGKHARWLTPVQSLNRRDAALVMKGRTRSKIKGRTRARTTSKLEAELEPAHTKAEASKARVEQDESQTASADEMGTEVNVSFQAKVTKSNVEAELGPEHTKAEEAEAEVEQNEAQTASSEALAAALNELEEDIKELPVQDSDENSYSSTSTRKSNTVRELEGFALEARSFVLGVRRQLEELKDNVVEKVKVETAAAASVADFALRRLLLQARAEGRVLPTSSDRDEDMEQESFVDDETIAARDRAMPFASRKGKIERTRAESQVESADREQVGLVLAAQADAVAKEKQDAKEWAEQAAQQEEGVKEAVEFVKEASGWAAAFVIAMTGAVSDALQTDKSSAGTPTTTPSAPKPADIAKQLPQLTAVADRTQNVGVALQKAVAATVATTRADYASYLQLRKNGQLPTLLEEVQSLDLPVLPVLPSVDLPALPMLPSQPAKPKLLGALELGSSATKLRQRREFEGALKQMRFAAAVGNRAAKDSGDTFVFGALPAVSAVGKVAARRIGGLVPAQMGTDAMPTMNKPSTNSGLESGVPSSLVPASGAGRGAAGLLRELSQQLAVEYAASAQAGTKAGILPDLTEAVGGPTRQMMKGVSAVLPSFASTNLPEAPASAELGANQALSSSGIAAKQTERLSAGVQLAGALGPQVGLSRETVERLFERYRGDASGVPIARETLKSALDRMSNSGDVIADSEPAVIEGPTSRMVSDEDVVTEVGGLTLAEQECDIIMDVDCISVEQVQEEDTVTEQIVAAIDLLALTAEVGADTLSPAVNRAADVLTAGTELDDWKLLGSLQPKTKRRRQRSETARQELLDAYTKLIDRA